MTVNLGYPLMHINETAVKTKKDEVQRASELVNTQRFRENGALERT